MNTNQMYYRSPEFEKAVRLMQITEFLRVTFKMNDYLRWQSPEFTESRHTGIYDYAYSKGNLSKIKTRGGTSFRV